MHFTSLENGVSFDFNGDGKPLFMAWTDPAYHNAWLALDRDRNGKIDNVQELFGYPTEPQLPTQDGTRNGWLALAAYDDPSRGGNGDGLIDANDSIYSSLLLWLDENHDGISQPTELHHLAEMRVKSIRLKYKDRSYSDENGNTFQYQSFFGFAPDDQNRRGKQEKHEAWDVVLNASETPPGNPDPKVLCGPTQK